MSRSSVYDVAVLSDLRLHGGTAASVAEEVRAHAAAGFRTALVHVRSALVEGNAEMARPIRRCVTEGLADLVTGEPVRAWLAVLRPPAAFGERPYSPVSVRADQVAVVSGEVTDADGMPRYDLAQVAATVRGALRAEAVWYPLGPRARRSLEQRTSSGITLAGEDWRSPIEVGEWHIDRSGGVRGTPVIGRHGRAEAANWPDRPVDILAAYPDGDDIRVRILGGAGPAADVLGRLPEQWVVEPFGARDPADFLAEVDFYVYFPGSGWAEGSRRSIVEAMASGAVVIVPEECRESFGDAAVYADPAEVADVVRALSADRDAYAAHSQRGTEFVAAAYSREAYVARLRGLLGAPSGEARHVRSLRRAREHRRVLFVSSNGAGMGHLTRLLAMARRANDGIEPVFLSMSQAVPVVERYGFPWEYCPSRADLDVDATSWNILFADRLAEVLRTFEPRALVFDGTWPYRGLRETRNAFPDLAYVWSRRPMWRSDTDARKLDHAGLFDLIIEPGELATEFDRGPTVGRGDAHVVGPVTLLSRDEMLDREQARAELGMDPQARALLVTLGAGNINDIASDLEVIADSVAERDGWQVYATNAPIAWNGVVARSDVHVLSVYPLARYLRAFDGAVAAAGYNSYHELVMAGVPTIFVPNCETATDDQYARAAFAEKNGIGMCLQTVRPEMVDEALNTLTTSDAGAAMRQRAQEIYPTNGAAAAMRLVEGLVNRDRMLQRVAL